MTQPVGFDETPHIMTEVATHKAAGLDAIATETYLNTAIH